MTPPVDPAAPGRLCWQLHDLCLEAFGYTDACCEEMSVILCYLLRRAGLDASIESGYYAYTDPCNPDAGKQIGDHQHVVLEGIRYDPTRDQFMDGQPLICAHQGPDEYYVEEVRFSFAPPQRPDRDDARQFLSHRCARPDRDRVAWICEQIGCAEISPRPEHTQA